MSLYAVLQTIAETAVYQALVVFYGLYPVLMAFIWVILALIYFHRRESGQPALLMPSETPFVSVVVPAFNEENSIGATIAALQLLDYPSYEVIVVDDGSTDGTAAKIKRYLSDSRVRLLSKQLNEGKAMALNDAVPICRGEIIVFVDSDIVAAPLLLQAFVPHFLSPRVAAVTGNPRVLNRGSLLRDLQTLEFASIISVQRRAQRIWGRVLTVSGAVFAIRRTALIEVGMFDPSMATEDIDLTWRLQRSLWDVRYEPSAVVWMHVPEDLPGLWKQRRRWARGLAQVLKRHWKLLIHWRERRMWPVFCEAALSILWAYTFLFISAHWLLSRIAGYAVQATSPVPNVWGMLVATACVTQLLTGVLMDRRYDPDLLRHFPVAIFYPLVYWALMTLITAIYTIDALVRARPRTQVWNTRRVAAVVIVVLITAGAGAQTTDECAAWNDRGRELAWSDRSRDAIELFDRVVEQCPSHRNSARLRKALVLRWQDRPAAAEALYKTVVVEGNEGEKKEAAAGLGYVDLMRDANRSALERFESAGNEDGTAIARYRLGDVAGALSIVRAAGERGELSHDLRDLREPVTTSDRPQLRSNVVAFHDADQTGFRSMELATSLGWQGRGRGEFTAGRSMLADDRSEVDGSWAGLSIEHRWSGSSAARAVLRASDYGSWRPLSGELAWTFTPDDRWRFDLGAARLLITDNIAAMKEELTGDFVSAGFDRATPEERLTWTAAADLTRWSSGNRRTRARISARKILEGVPRITVEWPSLLQLYDEPFAFRLWSPERYLETGPGLNVYQRWRRVWNLSAYVRAGVQRETGEPWRPFTTIRFTIDRDLRNAWAVRASTGWSNSNVAGSGGFRRASAQAELVRRF